MPKNIVILLDGTSNEISNQRTNILRLYGCLKKSETQLVYYDPGVGTLGGKNVWSRWGQKMVEVFQMATGWGLDQNVKEAYRFLVENYDATEIETIEHGKKVTRTERDQIYIFGFSRGAYTARVLAGLINGLGLLEPRNLNLLDYAYRAYKGVQQKDREAPSFASLRLFERSLRPDRPPIRCLGLFDTVSSVIEPGPRNLPMLRTHVFTNHNPSVEAVCHAVALDERRRMFVAKPWPETQEYWGNPFNKKAAKPQEVHEVWFTGVHADIGGGYGEPESGLAKIPLDWMIRKTRDYGLVYNTATINRLVLGTSKDNKYCAPDPFSEAHDSMTPGWKILEYLPFLKSSGSRRKSFCGLSISLFEPRAVPENARIHASVLARCEKLGQKPVNLPSKYRIEDEEGETP
ncbi:MAG: DUF2235 domain-containing protein [Shimia thalassica]|uniref:DUF2235 domain-containing protein n=1 Tax=Shimia thalassica TaxID=1715693 RepID=UPI003299CBE4